jgi:hypothetical protein
LAVELKGTPGRFVILDTIASTKRQAGLLPGLAEDTFVSVDSTAEFPLNCAPKKPGPSATDQITVVPGEGAPPGEDAGGACSSTSEGETCDVNYCVVLPPSGTLALRTLARPLQKNESELLLS